MIVAGLELTSETRRPSSRSTRQAWVPEESNSQAWPMTIGPEPITRTWWMSSRRGMCSAPSHQACETVEQVGGVVGPGGRLRVVLHREGRDVGARQPLDDPVVGAPVGQVDVAVRGGDVLAGRPGHGEPVVLARDGERPGGVVDVGDVDAPVSVPELEGPEPQGAPQDLVAEADAEE